MDDSLALKLRRLLAGRSVAALGTLHAGAPYVSMVPFALLEDASAFVIHVSRLAAHTNDMLADPRVSLLVMEAEQPGVSPQALPRATVLGRALELTADSADHARARNVYLKRFPSSAPMFELGDFSLFTITPDTVRWVAGFGQALSLTPASFAKAVRGTG
jgi:putative heme iron utilization protein